MQGTPGTPIGTPPRAIPVDTSGIDTIEDKNKLKLYLEDYDTNEKAMNKGLAVATETSGNSFSSFLTTAATTIGKEFSPFLRKMQYQLSSSTSASSSPKSDDKSSPMDPHHIKDLEMWKKLNVDIVTLTKWNENLRIVSNLKFI